MLERKEVRDEEGVFRELEQLCISPGYVHAIAYFCFRDNTIKYSDEVKPEDVLQQFSMERLIRTEISTLIGLSCKNEINEILPPPETIQEYINKTDSLLQELHQSMMQPPEEIFNPSKIGNVDFNPFDSGSVLRESIFYGGESAYHFQYRDFSEVKYRKDDDWLIDNKGYSLEQAIGVVSSIQALQNDKINDVLNSLVKKHPDDWSVLDAYTFTAEEVALKSGIDLGVTKKIIESFVSPIGHSNSRPRANLLI